MPYDVKKYFDFVLGFKCINMHNFCFKKANIVTSFL